MSKVNFDEWANLYRTNPDEFEKRRTELLNNHIRSAPIQHRNMLRIIQLEVDTIRQEHTPEESFVIISEMLALKLKDLRANITELREILEDTNRTE